MYRIFIAPDGRKVIVAPPQDRTKGVVKYRYEGSTDSGVCETLEFLRTFKVAGREAELRFMAGDIK